jgi:hypothetical protein
MCVVAMSNNNSGGQAFNSEDFKAQQRRMLQQAGRLGGQALSVELKKLPIRLRN